MHGPKNKKDNDDDDDDDDTGPSPMLQRLALRIYFEFLSKYQRMYIFACILNSVRQKLGYHFTVIVSNFLSIEQAGLMLGNDSVRISAGNRIS